MLIKFLVRALEIFELDADCEYYSILNIAQYHGTPNFISKNKKL